MPSLTSRHPAPAAPLRDSAAALPSRFHLSRYAGSRLVQRRTIPVAQDRQEAIDFADAGWSIWTTPRDVFDRSDATDWTFHLNVTRGTAVDVTAGVEWQVDDWSPQHYLVLPGAVYAGNRFMSRPLTYSPALSDPADIGPDVPTIITDVPRLNADLGTSRLQQLTRDLATPAVGIFDPHGQNGLWLLLDPATEFGDTGIDIEENDDRTRAVVRFTCPGVREGVRYTVCNSQKSSKDRGATIGAGRGVTLKVRAYAFSCPDILAFYDRFFRIRKDLVPTRPTRHELPFSAAFHFIEAKYNAQNWTEPEGYYAVGMRENKGQDWQLGWTGGAISTLPLLAEGNLLSRDRALRNLAWLFANGQTEAGFFRSFFHRGDWSDDRYAGQLIRRAGDTLYYLIKHFQTLEAHGETVNPAWRVGARRLADGLQNVWRKNGQFGQYVDAFTGRIIIGNSTSGGIIPAGLALAAKYWGQDSYRQTAEDSAAFLYEQFIKQGYTTGGPGDALQCPDSESAAGLMESLVCLWELTGEEAWLGRAKDAAHQLASWVMSYDYPFPAQSTLGRLDMRSTGTVFANVQNKHSAPGLCTYSGSSLLRLFRATGDVLYLVLLHDIAHALPQFVSRADRPICSPDSRAMPEGWMNERVNTSDWLEPIGEIFHGSCWCETSLMLTWAELPGVYVRLPDGLIVVLDHVEAAWSADRRQLTITNPTQFDAVTRVLIDRPATRTLARVTSESVRIPAGHRINVDFGTGTV